MKYKYNEKDTKDMIKFICNMCDIQYTNEFIDYVYNKNVGGISGAILKELKKEFEKKVGVK